MSIHLPLWQQGLGGIDETRHRNHDRSASSASPGLRSDTPADAAVDRLELSPPVGAIESGETSTESGKGPSGAGYRIAMHFDLFYQLTQKFDARMGTDGVNRFHQVTASVTEKFSAGFSLSIDPVGKYLKTADRSLDVDPEVVGRFLDSVEELADLSPEALAGFLDEADRFFGHLEETYGELGGGFDEMRDLVKHQALAFFDDVGQIRRQNGGLLAAAQTQAPPASELVGPGLAGQPSGVPTGVQLADRTGRQVSLEQYREFLEAFDRYRERLSIAWKRMTGPAAGYGQIGKTDEASGIASSAPAIDTLVGVVPAAGPGALAGSSVPQRAKADAGDEKPPLLPLSLSI